MLRASPAKVVAMTYVGRNIVVTFQSEDGRTTTSTITEKAGLRLQMGAEYFIYFTPYPIDDYLHQRSTLPLGL